MNKNARQHLTVGQSQRLTIPKSPLFKTEDDISLIICVYSGRFDTLICFIIKSSAYPHYIFALNISQVLFIVYSNIFCKKYNYNKAGV